MKFFDKKDFAKLLIKYRYLSIGLVLIVVCLLATGLTKLTFNPDLETYFPEGHPAVIRYNEIDDMFIPTDNLIIAVHSNEGTLFNGDSLKVIEELTKKSWTIPYSVRVDSLTNYSYVKSVNDDLIVEPFIEEAEKKSIEFFEKRENLVAGEDIIYKSLISEDKKTSVVSIIVDPPGPNKEDQNSELINYILGFIEPIKESNENLDIRLLGNPYLDYISPRIVKAEMPVVMPLMLLLIFLIVFLMIRSYVAVLATFVVILMSLIATFGSIGILGSPLNQMVTTIPILIITLALADCIHLFSIYFQNRVKGISSKESMEKSLEMNIQPLFLTTISTCIGFLCLNFIEVAPLRDFGNAVAIGIGFAFIFTIFFIAPIVSFFEVKTASKVTKQTRFSTSVGSFILKNGNKLIFSITSISFLILLCIPMNELDENPTQMYAEGFTSFSSDTLWLDEKLSVTFPVNFLATNEEGQVSDPDFLKILDKFSVWLEEREQVNHVTSLANNMKNLNKSMHGDDPEWKKIPENADLSAQYLFFYEMSLPMGLDLNSSISQDRKSTKISATLKDMSANEFKEFNNEVLGYLQQNNLENMISEPSSFRVIFTYMVEAIVNSLLYGLFIGILLITLIIGLFFRSYLLPALSIFPNILPIGMGFGLWGLFVGDVGFMVAVGMGSTLGVIVDFTVHFLSKYELARKEFKKSVEESVIYSFETVGFALIIMTVVLALGFSVLNLVTFIPIQDFAKFSVICFIGGLIINFLFLPNLLMKFDKRKF
ncbi:MMPL family transporter [Gammaproteobacteria bacterium]|nr:MMPL family transporter [Gammaproteobacteria bacterium]